MTVSTTGGATVLLSDNAASLTVPASVTVGSGSTTATFTATAGTITSNQTAVVAATANGSSLTTSISLVASPPVQTLVYSTGVVSPGVLLADGAVDSHYKLVASSDPVFAGPNAVTVNSNAAPIPPWMANGPNSKWIAPRADQVTGDPPGTYTYRTTFDLTGFNVATAVLTGQWASDNEGVMLLNGVQVSTSGSSAYSAWIPFTINTGFWPGINTLDFVITNDAPSPNPTGLRVEIAGTATQAFSISMSPKTATLTANQQQQFAATVTGPTGIVWSVTSGPGSVSATGLYTAPATITATGTATVRAASTVDPTKFDTATITLSPAPPPVQIPVFNTGVASAGVLLADGAVDSHYKLAASADPAFAGPNAVTVNSNAYPIPPWTANGPNSKWIAPRANAGTGNSAGVYTYRTTFDLTGLNVATAVLTGQWASDNEGVMKLNGTTVSTSSYISFAGWVPFTINTGFLSGINTIDFVITNDAPGPNPTGLRVEIAGTAAALSAPATLLSLVSRIPSNVAGEGTSARTKTPSSDQKVYCSDACLDGIRLISVACSPRKIQAGDSFTCTVRLSTPNIPQIAHMAVRSDSPNLKSPSSLTTRPGQAQLDFNVYSDPLAKQQTSAVMVQFGQTSVIDTVVVRPATAPILSLPPQQLTKIGKQVAFTVSAIDPDGRPLILSVGALPAGASFDAGTGNFSWTAQRGTYDILFTATNSTNVSAAGDVSIQVDSGEPAITDVRNAASQVPQRACSPGSIASLVGRWLATGDQSVSDPSGTFTQLAGTRVKVNGVYAPVLYASVGRIDFQCPGGEPGTILDISAETEAGVTNTVATTMQDSAPGLYPFDGSGQGQGLVTIAGSSLLATSRSYQTTGQPAEPGDRISLLATGIGRPEGAAFLQVKIADSYVSPDSVQAVPGMAGAYQVNVRVPGSVPAGDAIPIVLHVSGSDGNTFQSNTITIAIEPAR